MDKTLPIDAQQNLTPIGRFAPSPTGSLHLGSLVAALASYMIAKQPNGKWLVRIEDIDRPREVAGSAKHILQTLEDFGLHWDNSVVYQSQRTQLYQQALEVLSESQLVYQCDCSRKTLRLRNKGIYDGFCRQLDKPASNKVATRVKFKQGFENFHDMILGSCRFNSTADQQDFVVKRRGGLFAYQLAVVADDIAQDVNQVVRGSDILDSTPRQNFLYHCLQHETPSYYHLPLVLDSSGEKISKRFTAKKIEKKEANKLLLQALTHLGQSVDSQMRYATTLELISHFEQHWCTEKIGRAVNNAVSNTVAEAVTEKGIE